MKRIKLSISDDSGDLNIGSGASPLWKDSERYDWEDLYVRLNLQESLVTRIRSWRDSLLQANELYSWENKREELVKCEIEGLAIFLELRKELPDYQITYSSTFNSYHCVLNEEQVDDS